MASKQLETVSGTVEQINAKQTGIKVAGEWLNISQFHPVAVMPTPGELVEVVVEITDRGKWINSLKIIGAAPTPTTGSSSSTSRDRLINRMSALRSAAIYCGHRATVVDGAKSSDVLVLAEAWLKWIEKKEDDQLP